MALRGFNIAPYEEKLRIFELEQDKERDGETPTYIKFKQLSEYIKRVNSGTYGIPYDKRQPEKKTSYLLSNYVTGKIAFICFFSTNSGDLLTGEMNEIVARSQVISSYVNDHDESTPGLSSIDSVLEVIIITKNKISPYPRDRVASISQITILKEITVMSEPHNNVFQSEHKVANSSERKEFENIPKSKMPSISSSDEYMQYLGIANKLTKIHRFREDSDFMDVKIHTKYVL